MRGESARVFPAQHGEDTGVRGNRGREWTVWWLTEDEHLALYAPGEGKRSGDVFAGRAGLAVIRVMLPTEQLRIFFRPTLPRYGRILRGSVTELCLQLRLSTLKLLYHCYRGWLVAAQYRALLRRLHQRVWRLQYKCAQIPFSDGEKRRAAYVP